MKIYNKIFFIIVLSTIGLTVVSNIVIDTYKVFGIFNVNTKYVHENKRFKKIDHLKKHKDYNAFILGNSRVNWIDVAMANQLTGYRFYNMAVGAEKIHTLKKRVEWLLSHDHPIDLLLIGLDYDVMFACQDIPQTALSAKEHPDITGESLIKFYFPYFFRFDLTSWRRSFKNRNKPLQYTSDLNTGHWYLPYQDQLIEKDHEHFLKNNFLLDEACEPAPQETEKNLERLRDLVKLLKRHRIKTIYIVNPYHHTFYRRFVEDGYQRWLNQVANICSTVWDFSGLNSVTLDDHLYYEASHYRRQVGDLILQRIFNKSEMVPPDFGQLLKSVKIP